MPGEVPEFQPRGMMVMARITVYVLSSLLIFAVWCRFAETEKRIPVASQNNLKVKK